MGAAPGTSTTRIYGVGPVVAAMALSITGHINRIRSAEHFAAYNGTVPSKCPQAHTRSTGCSMGGNRQLNHAIHIAAVSQIRHRNSSGRVYYDRKIAEGKSSKMALRALKRQISNAPLPRHDRRRQETSGQRSRGPGRAIGERL